MVINSSARVATAEALMDGKYILDGDGNPVLCPDLVVWGQWMENKKTTKDWIVEKTTVGGVEVSTVFLGLDHNYVLGDPPLLFETMCFQGAPGEEFDGEEFFARYATREEAAAGHAKIVKAVKAESSR